MKTRIMQINGLDSAIELELKNRKDIKNCPEGAVVIIHDYVGRFAGIYDEGVRMKSIPVKLQWGLIYLKLINIGNKLNVKKLSALAGFGVQAPERSKFKNDFK